MTASNETTLPEHDSGTSTPQQQPRYRLYPSWMYGVIAVFFIATYQLISWCNTSKVSWNPVGASFYFWGGVIGCIFIWLRLGRTKNPITLVELLAFLSIAGMTAAAVLPEYPPYRRSPARYCELYLEMIGEELQAYHDQHGHFPPAIVRGEDNQPQHSWRGLLLKKSIEESQAEGKKLEYKLNQPWTSNENKEALASYGPFSFVCFASQNTDDQGNLLCFTNYVAVIGNDTAWAPDGSPRSLNDISDPANTALLIEMANSDILPTEPRDITLDDLTSGKIPWEHISPHPYRYSNLTFPQSGMAILFADESTHYCVGIPTPEEIRQLFSISKKKTEPPKMTPESYYIFGDCNAIYKKQPIRAAVYYLWVACLVTIFAAIFLPLKGKA